VEQALAIRRPVVVVGATVAGLVCRTLFGLEFNTPFGEALSEPWLLTRASRPLWLGPPICAPALALP
jgi:hypothetical protein